MAAAGSSIPLARYSKWTSVTCPKPRLLPPSKQSSQENTIGLSGSFLASREAGVDRESSAAKAMHREALPATSKTLVREKRARNHHRPVDPEPSPMDGVYALPPALVRTV